MKVSPSCRYGKPSSFLVLLVGLLLLSATTTTTASIGVGGAIGSRRSTATAVVGAGAADAGSVVPAGTTAETRRRSLQATASTTTTTTTSLIADALSAEMAIIDADTAAPKLKVVVTYQGDSYIALAFSLDKFMAGSYAVIGTPSNNRVLKYEMTGRVMPTVLSDDRQTLQDASIVSDGAVTTLSFTKLLKEENEIEIVPNGDNIFLYAIGNDGVTDLQFHSKRGDVTVNFATGITASSDPEEYKALWQLHGITMAIAWMLLIPLGIGCSVARALIPNQERGVWFALHRGINAIGLILTIVGFGIAVYVIGQEQGDTAQHFTTKTHHQIGLAVFIVAMVNAIYGICRPPAPHAPVEIHDHSAVDDDDDDAEDDRNNKNKASPSAAAVAKSPARIVFEYGHRIMGLAAIILAWFNVSSGIELLHVKYDDLPGWYSEFAAWIVMTVVAVSIIGLGVVGRMKK